MSPPQPKSTCIKNEKYQPNEFQLPTRKLNQDVQNSPFYNKVSVVLHTLYVLLHSRYVFVHIRSVVSQTRNAYLHTQSVILQRLYAYLHTLHVIV